MTAIKEFERLEALGLWRETSHAQRREVIVSFGESTLVLSDINNRPITHWSLAAISQAEVTENSTIYTVDDFAEETLEIDDPLMLSAIEKIRASIEAHRPHPGRLRWYLGAVFLIAFISFSLFWLPNALTRYAASIIPDSKAVEIGDAVIASIEKTTGSTCTTPSGERALRRFEDRVIGAPSNRVRIMEMGSRPSLLLPGGNILLNHSLTTNRSDAYLLAGYALMERAAEDEQSPLFEMFKTLGIRKTLAFLGTGNIENSDLEKFADERLFGAPSKPQTQTLMDLFTLAKLPHLEFADHANRADLRDLQDTDISDYDPILSDNDWIGLQEICSE